MFKSIHRKNPCIAIASLLTAACLLAGSTAQAQTSVTYLQVPPSGNLAGSGNDGPQTFNLPGYGTVAVELTNPTPSPVGVTFFDQTGAYNEQTSNTLYNWGVDTQRFNIYNGNTGVIENYQFNFAFLSGPPNPADLYLAVIGLAQGTTAKVSQAGTLVGEYTFPGSPSSSTTLYGVAGPNTFSSANNGDPLNTGWALWQPTGPLLTNTGGYPILSLDVNQVYPDGIGFTVGYTTVPEPTSLGFLIGAGMLLPRFRRKRSELQQ